MLKVIIAISLLWQGIASSALPTRCASTIDQILKTLNKPVPIQGSFATLRELAKNPLEIGTKKKSLLQKIEYWSKVANREIKMSELRRIEMQSFLYESLRIDSPYRTASELKHLFFAVEENYFSLLAKEREITSLKSLKGIVSGKNGMLELAQLIESFKQDQTFSSTLLQKISKTYNKNDVLLLIDNEIVLVEDQILKRAFDIHRQMPEYSTARNFLEKMLTNNDAKIASNSAEILKNLKSNILIDGLTPYYRGVKIETPALKDLIFTLGRYPLAELLSLKQEVRIERASSLIGRLPNHKLHELMDIIVSKIPWANNPEIRSYLRSVIDEKNKLVFYPQIDRVVYSDGKIADKVKLLREIDSYDAKGELLSIFARRSDVIEDWRKMYAFAEEQAKMLTVKLGDMAGSDAEVLFFYKLKEAQGTLKTLGPLAPWHVPQKAHYFRVVVDGVFLTTGSYAVYKLGNWSFHKVFPNGPEADSKPDPTIVNSKAPTPVPAGTIAAKRPTSDGGAIPSPTSVAPAAPLVNSTIMPNPPQLDEVLNETESALEAGAPGPNPFEL